MTVTIDNIEAAAAVIAADIVRTPTTHSPSLSREAGCDLHLKLENL
jgi:threonine dehydratase